MGLRKALTPFRFSRGRIRLGNCFFDVERRVERLHVRHRTEVLQSAPEAVDHGQGDGCADSTGCCVLAGVQKGQDHFCARL